MKINHKIWLEKDGKVIFGKGRDDLLKAIDECRSLNAAAKKLNMSYRAAWGRLKASEERMGIKLVEVDGTGKGMHLTAQARQMISTFDKLDEQIETILGDAGREIINIVQTKTSSPENKDGKIIQQPVADPKTKTGSNNQKTFTI